MGYVHDTHMSQFFSALNCQFTAGTWTPTISDHIASMVRGAADASFTVLIPINLPGNASAFKGIKIKSIDVFYAIGTAAADDFPTVQLEKMTLGANDTAISGQAVTISLDAAHDTAVERLAADDDHMMTITITTPEWSDNDLAYVLQLVVDCAATTVFTLFGARVNYDLRV